MSSSDSPLTPARIAVLYPQLYSAKRLDEWQALFADAAMAVRSEPGAETTFLNIGDAMPEQREYAAENATFLEEWDNIELHQFGNIAVIKADYSLTVDHEIRKGVDVLTLVNGVDGWRIVNLAYEQTHLIPR